MTLSNRLRGEEESIASPMVAGSNTSHLAAVSDLGMVERVRYSSCAEMVE
jgi:hypothetical protein